VLADLRPSTRMLAELEDQLGADPDLRAAAGTVTVALRAARVLICLVVELDGELVDVDQPAVRDALEREHAGLLAAHGMEHLNIAEIRSRTRIVTQTIGRSLYEQGAGGIAFGSNHDDQPCYALFEGHARLIAAEDAKLVMLTEDLEILRQVCTEWQLRIEPGA